MRWGSTPAARTAYWNMSRAAAWRNAWRAPPSRFVPRYWMVTFSRVPYTVAFARGEIQARILRELTAGKASLDEIDLARADALVAQRLTLLDG